MVKLTFATVAATVGQVLLARHDLRGLGLYALAILALLWVLRREGQVREFAGGPVPAKRAWLLASDLPDQVGYRRLLRVLFASLALANAVLAYVAAADNTYRWYGVLSWLLAVGLFILVFWERQPGPPFWHKLGLSRDGWRLSWTALAVAGLVLLGFEFRFWRLAALPPEMTSDHVEKLLDVHDLVSGQRPIFFARNTGREPWQFYWTFMFIRLFDLETKYLALKVGTAAVGLLTLPGVYLLGRELFGRQVGLWATLFTAVASWPVILSRVGLRFPFAPAVTVWSLLFMLRGLRDGRRNDFLLLGLSLGVGLHGYTAFRAMPLAVAVCWGLVLILRPASLAGERGPLLRNALLAVLIAGVVCIPLGRFALEHPDNFWMRSASRMVDPRQDVPDGPAITFFKNLANLAAMFHWRGDDVWVNTLARAPVLDPLLGGLLALGLVVALWRGLRQRDPIAPLLLVGGGILLLPSALSLAFPIENPSVVRTGGAIPVVMVVAALPLGLDLERGRERLRGWRRGWLAVGALALILTVSIVNYQRLFVTYAEQYQRHVLNTTEVGATIRGFVDSGGDPANAWIVVWPFWVDTRGAGIELGDPTWNNVILDVLELDDHVRPGVSRPRFYVLHPQDWQALRRLQELFPRGWAERYHSRYPRRDFVMFYVPAEPSPIPGPAGG